MCPSLGAGIRQQLTETMIFDRLGQAYFLAIGKKTQGEKNSKLKKKTQTQAQNSIFRHILENLYFL